MLENPSNVEPKFFELHRMLDQQWLAKFEFYHFLDDKEVKQYRLKVQQKCFLIVY